MLPSPAMPAVEVPAGDNTADCSVTLVSERPIALPVFAMPLVSVKALVFPAMDETPLATTPIASVSVVCLSAPLAAESAIMKVSPPTGDDLSVGPPVVNGA